MRFTSLLLADKKKKIVLGISLFFLACLVLQASQLIYFSIDKEVLTQSVTELQEKIVAALPKGHECTVTVRQDCEASGKPTAVGVKIEFDNNTIPKDPLTFDRLSEVLPSTPHTKMFLTMEDNVISTPVGAHNTQYVQADIASMYQGTSIPMGFEGSSFDAQPYRAPSLLSNARLSIRPLPRRYVSPKFFDPTDPFIGFGGEAKKKLSAFNYLQFQEYVELEWMKYGFAADYSSYEVFALTRYNLYQFGGFKGYARRLPLYRLFIKTLLSTCSLKTFDLVKKFGITSIKQKLSPMKCLKNLARK